MNTPSDEIQALPKVELHLHLDCSLSFDVVHAIDPSITQERYQEEFIAPPKCTDLVDFLTRAVHGYKLMQTEEQLRLVTLDLLQQLRRDNVIYAEIRFAPLLHTEQGLSAEQVVAAVNAAANEGSEATGVECRLILCTMRHYSEEQSLQTAGLVEQFRGTRVAALDIAGDEAGYPLTPHIAAFQYAEENGLHRTAHAGEASGPESVRETLRDLHPTRIGHGVRSAEDPDLLTQLRDRGIHLEVCPTSNVQTNVVDTYADHPVNRLWDAGVPLNINTDCRTISNIDLRREYRKLHEVFGWDAARFQQTNLAAIDVAFIPEEVKGGLRERLLQANAAEKMEASFFTES